MNFKCMKCGSAIKCTDLFCPKCGQKADRQANLIAAAQHNDQTAYTELYNQIEKTVRVTVFSMVSPGNMNNADAEDIILDSILKGFKSLSMLKNPESFVPWMRQIARNKSIDYLRQNKDVNFSQLDTEDGEFENTLVSEDRNTQPELVMDDHVKADLIREMLTSIPDEQRVVMTMFYYHQMTIPEIASELKTTQATVKSRLKYGKTKIEKSVNELQKKHGIKLYSITPVLLLTLFIGFEKSVPANAAVLDTVLASAQAGTGSAAGTGTTSGNSAVYHGTAKAVSGTAGKAAVKAAVVKAAAGTAAKAGLGTLAKVIIAVTAAAAVAAGSTAAVIVHNQEAAAVQSAQAQTEEAQNTEVSSQTEQISGSADETTGESAEVSQAEPELAGESEETSQEDAARTETAESSETEETGSEETDASQEESEAEQTAESSDAVLPQEKEKPEIADTAAADLSYYLGETWTHGSNYGGIDTLKVYSVSDSEIDFELEMIRMGGGEFDVALSDGSGTFDFLAGTTGTISLEDNVINITIADDEYTTEAAFIREDLSSYLGSGWTCSDESGATGFITVNSVSEGSIDFNLSIDPIGDGEISTSLTGNSGTFDVAGGTGAIFLHEGVIDISFLYTDEASRQTYTFTR